MKKALFSLLFFLGAFFCLPAKALVIQPDYATTLYRSGSDMVGTYQNFLTTPTYPTGRPIQYIQIKFVPNSHCFWKLKLFNTSLAQLDSDVKNIYPSDDSLHTFSFTPDANFRDDNIQKFILDSGAGSPCGSTNDYDGLIYGSATTSSLPEAIYSDGSLIVKNMFLNLVPEKINQIAFSTTSGNVCDFNNWGITNTIADADTTTSLNWSAEVMYGTSPDVMIYQDNYGGLGSLSYPWYIPKSADLVSGHIYYAQAFLCDTTTPFLCDFSYPSHASHIIASSSIWQFAVNGYDLCQGKTDIQTANWPTSTSTNEIGVGIRCNPADGAIKNTICEAMADLFNPNPIVLQKFSDLKSAIQYKPPFGYISIYTSTTLGLTTTTATTSVDFSEISNFEPVQFLRSLLTWFFYLILGIWIIKRLSHFSLHG